MASTPRYCDDGLTCGTPALIRSAVVGEMYVRACNGSTSRRRVVGATQGHPLPEAVCDELEAAPRGQRHESCTSPGHSSEPDATLVALALVSPCEWAPCRQRTAAEKFNTARTDVPRPVIQLPHPTRHGPMAGVTMLMGSPCPAQHRGPMPCVASPLVRPRTASPGPVRRRECGQHGGRGPRRRPDRPGRTRTRERVRCELRGQGAWARG